MKTKKTPQAKRGTYKLFDDNGIFVMEYKPGKDGVTEVDILNLHKMDDHEVYVNAKENRLPEWYQPVYEEWKAKFIADFRERYGREPFADEIPGRHRILESLDGQTDPDGDGLGDSSRLEEQLSISDEEEVPDTIIRLRELVAAMPEQWQKVYRLVFMKGLSKAKAGKEIGISDVRVGQLVKKINAAIAGDEFLKNLYR
ncbi:hypothetical protein ACPW7J_05340 [Ihubacter sp. rT4E-8]|uniref:hypothetical protein n=1 Tax=Ihubacter sp. rT4E-8 TaxID=3242369 RepID=UPI0030551200|nr:hypothetical protein [Lachnospiraceae bacterium]